MARQTADAVVIGAGINGASTAYNLVKRGLKVTLIEKYVIASGGTGRSAAIVRQHYSNPELVKMVKRSAHIFQNFDDEVGGDPGFVDCGWSFLVPAYASDAFSRNMELLSEHEIETKEISKQDLLEIDPRFNLDDVERIAYEPHSGYADPHASTYAYVKRFTDLGGKLRQMTPVRGLTITKGKLTAVETDDGTIATETVVNAAGPWADRVGKWVGLEIPIEITREQEVLLETTDAGGPPRVVCSDMAKAIYYRPDIGTRTVLGRGYPKDYEQVDPDSYVERADPEFVEESGSRLMERLPAYNKALVVDTYCGLYDVTPDWHPILGRVAEPEGFIMCAGFSGHGFKTGPALGELMAEEVIDGKATTVDISPFSLSRFAQGNQFEAAYGGNRA